MNGRPYARLFLFSGLGSQYYRMAQGLYESAPDFRREFDRLSALIDERSGVPLKPILFATDKTRGDPFDDPLHGSLAVFLVERALVLTLRANGLEPSAAAGSSIGMVAAAVTAGALVDESDAIDLILRICGIFDEHCPPGGLVAVFENGELYDRDPVLGRLAELAGVDFRGSYVLAAEHEALGELESYLDRLGIAHQRLPVKFAYHSRWIDVVKEHMLEAVRQTPLRRPMFPLYCCSQVRRLDTFTPLDIWLAIREPLRHAEFFDLIDSGGSNRYIDVGPAGTLATTAKYNLPASSASTIEFVLNRFQAGAARRLSQLTSKERSGLSYSPRAP